MPGAPFFCSIAYPSVPTAARDTPARAAAVRDGPSSGHQEFREWAPPAGHRLQRRGVCRCHDPAPSVAGDENEWRLRRRRGLAHHQPEPVGSEGRKEDGHDPCHRTPPMEVRALARRAADELDEPPRTPHPRQGQRRRGQGDTATASRLSVVRIGRLSPATPTTQRNAEISQPLAASWSGRRDAGIGRRATSATTGPQPEMTQTFLKAIEDRLLVAAFEIDDRSDFRSAWARAGRRDRAGRDPAGLCLASAPRYRRRRRQPPPVDRAVAATGALMQRPKRKTANRKPRVDFSEPERQRGRHAPAAALRSGGRGRTGLRCPIGAART